MHLGYSLVYLGVFLWKLLPASGHEVNNICVTSLKVCMGQQVFVLNFIGGRIQSSFVSNLFLRKFSVIPESIPSPQHPPSRSFWVRLWLMP